MKMNIRKKSGRMVNFDLAIQAGSAREQELGIPRGTAHFLEHLMFQGSKRFTQTEISKKIAYFGGDINAFTSKMLVCYQMTVPLEYFDQCLEYFSDMILNPILSEEEMERERAVIIEEYKKREDSADNILYEKFEESFFSNHNKSNVIGDEESIKSITISDIRKLWQTFYNSDRMNIFVTASDRKLAQQVVEKYFGKADGKALIDFKVKKNEPITHTAHLSFEDNTEVNTSLMAWNGPDTKGKSYFAWVVFSSLFGEGMDSILFQKIREDLRLVYGISSDFSGSPKSGHFIVSFATTHDEKKIFDLVIESLKEPVAEVTEEDLTRAKNKIKSIAYKVQDNKSSQLYIDMVHYFERGKKINIKKYLEAIERVTLAEVQAVAELLSKNPYLTVTIKGKNESISDGNET